ncbi:MAG: translation initiation factor IF-2 [Cyanobacteriota bacterium]|nr:translation initiation factor IF-2 [Cyanobacteriota bacterium]
MNTGKTRIYELSKELNRDNKDILEICERLNISVKSHSSTIDEAQVERIRTEAQRYPQKSVGSVATRSGESDRTLRPQPPREPRKPQIREILKSHVPSAPQAPSSVSANTPTPAGGPRPPSKPSKPVRLEAASADEEAPVQEEPPRETLEETGSAPVPPTPSETPESAVAPSEPPEKPLQLLSPPSRQSVREVAKAETAVEKPILNKPKKKDKSQPSEPSTSSVQGTRTPASAPASPEKSASKGSSNSPKTQLAEKPRPPRPPRSPAVAEVALDAPTVPSSDDDLEEDTLLDGKASEKPKLKRPTPPRVLKRDLEWEDDEEGAESKSKAGKVGKLSGKGKRRSALLEDEEEDLNELQEHLTPTTAVSISIARPPKPASMSGGATSTASNTRRTKKPIAKSDSSQSRSSSRGERQKAQKAVAVLPERVVLPENLTVRELAERLNISETDVITKLFLKGMAVNITQTLDRETATLIADELGVTVETVRERAAAAKTEMLEERDLESLQRRPPVVTIMGHVDHGKTTLLDSIRKTKVAQGEAGGITQHIGAYHVDVEHEDSTEQVVFLDTPGHEAFTAMRARGARVTDIAILVVAADDGVQPQTREAISHARAAEVPIIVAINKVDKPEANPERIMQELTELELIPEEWGGETIMAPVSALTGENLDTLLEMILLVAEVEQLEANPDRAAKGTVVEAHLDKAKGPVATLLVQNGTLRVGDTLVAGSTYGKLRAMIDDRGERVEEASPSFAVEILGLNDVPGAGDEFEVFEGEKQAREVAEKRAETERETRLTTMASGRVTLSSLSAQAQEGTLKELNLIIKADVQGSVEAILGSLQQLPQDEVQVCILLAAPGEVTETDVDFAAASRAVVIGFNTTLASGARQAAERAGVDIREYSIIYNLLDEIQGAMEGLLDPEEVEEYLGTAQVRQVFPVGKGAVAGCYVQEGRIVRNRRLRVRRGSEVVFEGTLDSLKREKENVPEVKAGFECGIGVAKFNDWKEGDSIEVYQMILKRRTLSQN